MQALMRLWYPLLSKTSNSIENWLFSTIFLHKIINTGNFIPRVVPGSDGAVIRAVDGLGPESSMTEDLMSSSVTRTRAPSVTTCSYE